MVAAGRSRAWEQEKDTKCDGPDRKADTRQYRAEPRSIFDYEPGRSSILEQEKQTRQAHTELAVEDEPWFKFFAELEFGRPPPKKQLDYSPEGSPQSRAKTSPRHHSPADRHTERPTSLASDFGGIRRKMEPFQHPRPGSSLTSQSSASSLSSNQRAPPEPYRSSSLTSSSLTSRSSEPAPNSLYLRTAASPTSPPGARGGDVSNSVSDHLKHFPPVSHHHSPSLSDTQPPGHHHAPSPCPSDQNPGHNHSPSPCLSDHQPLDHHHSPSSCPSDQNQGHHHSSPPCPSDQNPGHNHSPSPCPSEHQPPGHHHSSSPCPSDQNPGHNHSPSPCPSDQNPGHNHSPSPCPSDHQPQGHHHSSPPCPSEHHHSPSPCPSDQLLDHHHSPSPCSSDQNQGHHHSPSPCPSDQNQGHYHSPSPCPSDHQPQGHHHSSSPCPSDQNPGHYHSPSPCPSDQNQGHHYSSSPCPSDHQPQGHHHSPSPCPSDHQPQGHHHSPSPYPSERAPGYASHVSLNSAEHRSSNGSVCESVCACGGTECAEDLPTTTTSLKLKSWSYDDLLNEEGGAGHGQPRSKSTDVLSDDPGGVQGHAERGGPCATTHDAPGFLHLYKQMHHISRQALLGGHAPTVRTRVLEFESETERLHTDGEEGEEPPQGGGGGRGRSQGEVPKDVVNNRISQFESLIQKSKSLPELAGQAGLRSGRSSPHRRCFVGNLLDASPSPDPPTRNPPEGQPQYPSAAPPKHFYLSPFAPLPQLPSHSQHFQLPGGVASDSLRLEGSSPYSESDYDCASHTSSESLRCSSQLHLPQRHDPHQRWQLVSNCKGPCPASSTRFTTLRRHERTKHRPPAIPAAPAPHYPASQSPSRLASLVSPAPFSRKSSVYQALGEALTDIYLYLREGGRSGPEEEDEESGEEERGGDGLPASGLLHRLLAELLPDVPQRDSSLRATGLLGMSGPFALQHIYPPLPDSMASPAHCHPPSPGNTPRQRRGDANDSKCRDVGDERCQDQGCRRSQYTDPGPHVHPSRKHIPDIQEKQAARAVYDFKAQTAKELALRKGETVHILRQVDKNWYEGESRGQVGIFPISYVEKMAPAVRPQPVRPPPPVQQGALGEAVARYSFTADTPVELSLRKGERVLLLRQVDHNWFEGKLPDSGRQGIFPVSYVNVTRKSHYPQSSLPQSPSGDRLHPLGSSKRPAFNQDGLQCGGEPFQVLYNYAPRNEDELELREGEVVDVMEKCDDGWFVGTSRRSKFFGTFPGNYVRRL